MAFGRYYRYGYGRRYGYRRRTSRSVKAITTSRAYKASASNMTQNGRFNVNVKIEKTINIANGAKSVADTINIADYIKNSDMHKALSNVFDQYRIEKATIRFRPLVTSNINLQPRTTEGGVLIPVNNSYQTFFTCIDRTGFNNGQTLDSYRTYSSYKETVWPVNGDSANAHVVSLGQADVVSRSSYYDSKQAASFPRIAYGVDIGATNATGGTIPYSYSIEIDAQIRYRGVRLDTTAVF